MEENNSTTTTGNFKFTNGTITLIDNLFFPESQVKIETFNFIETQDGNFIEVVKRQTISCYLTPNWPTTAAIDRVWKEIYGISRNEKGKKELKLIKSIEGKVTPRHYVEEK